MAHVGSCFCGAVKLEVTGSPEAMGYCHCSSCRSWSAGPVNAFTLWDPDAVKVTQGADQIGKMMELPPAEAAKRVQEIGAARTLLVGDEPRDIVFAGPGASAGAGGSRSGSTVAPSTRSSTPPAGSTHSTAAT